MAGDTDDRAEEIRSEIEEGRRRKKGERNDKRERDRRFLYI